VPAVRGGVADKHMAERREAEKQRQEEEQRAFAARADQAIQDAITKNGWRAPGVEFMREEQRLILRDAIVAAMRWAQRK